MMLNGSAVTAALETCGITHVVWIPDSLLGTWEADLLQSNTIRLVRACREGEAIAIAGGLLLGGAVPLVMIQCTGLFEAGDSLRNIVHDLQLPLLMMVGVRNSLAHQAGTTTDNCPMFTEPILQAWQIPNLLLDPNRANGDDLSAALRHWQRSGEAGVVLIAE
jgi:sulfopyruvate decarboxylase TPP-binding subunit